MNNSRKTIDISADMGESLGRYELGNDQELMKYVSSANIACGFHAGDPGVMRKTVELAKKNGVAIGVHPGLPDVLGFGRRHIEITPQECKDYVTYQVGALKVFVEAYGLKLQHVMPHGVLFGMIAKDENLARGFIESIIEVDPKLIFVGRMGVSMEIARKKGLRTAVMLAADMQYRSDLTGVISPDHKKKATDPIWAAERILRVLDEERIETIDGSYANIKVDTVLVHGDGPNAVDVAKTLSEKLVKAGYKIRAFGRPD